MDTQIEVTPIILSFIADIPGNGIEFLKNLEEKIFTHILHKPYTEKEKENEAQIRWKRSATQILQDGYVYREKACTDETIVFIACCNAKGYETHFVKLIKNINNSQYTHSVAEVKLDNTWYLFDVNGKLGVQKGAIMANKEIDGYKLWKKGRDAWDIGLINFYSQTKIREI